MNCKNKQKGQKTLQNKQKIQETLRKWTKIFKITFKNNL